MKLISVWEGKPFTPSLKNYPEAQKGVTPRQLSLLQADPWLKDDVTFILLFGVSFVPKA
jgi:hypothetical protein